MAISRLGLWDRIEMVQADPMDANDVLRRDNPLGKIPTLVTDDGKAVYDSRVILEYLDHLAGGGRLIPTTWPARVETLTLQAMADGVIDASILIVYEARHRPEALHHQPWLDYQRGKVVRGRSAFASSRPIRPDSTSAPLRRLACSAISTCASRSTGAPNFGAGPVARPVPRQTSGIRRHCADRVERMREKWQTFRDSSARKELAAGKSRPSASL